VEEEIKLILERLSKEIWVLFFLFFLGQ
jgi:hypothetical protein